jgi:PAS domain S-box-containing protein
MALDRKKIAAIFLLSAGTYLLGVFLFAWWYNNQEYRHCLRQVDAGLLSAAEALEFMLAPDIHDRALDERSVSKEENKSNLRKLSEFAAHSKLEYAYMLVERDGLFYFAASSDTEEPTEPGSWYLYPYEDIPPDFVLALGGREPVYADYTDQWGSFRSVAIPEVSPGGRPYLVCADVSVSRLDVLRRKSTLKALGIAGFFLLLPIPFMLLYRGVNKDHTRILEAMNRRAFARTKELSSSNTRLEKEVSERMKAEASLKDSEERLKTILESVQAGIVIIEPGPDVIVYANPMALGMIGLPEEEVLNRVCQDFICPQEIGRCPKRDSGRAIDNAECLLLTAGRESVPILKTVTSISLNGKEHYLESFIDIGSLKRAEEEKRLLESKLTHSQKMEAVGTLAGGIAHDFNNILGAILGFAQLVEMTLPHDDESRPYVENIISAGKRAADLIRHILTFSRKREGEFVPTDVVPVLKESLKLLRAGLPAMVEIRLDVQAESASILCDPTQIQQVIMNLCTNAAQAMRDSGGEIYVSLRLEEMDWDRAAGFPELTVGSYAVLAVRDTGPGIETTIQDRIFDPYFTTKPPGEGTGLGLATVHGIARSHKGCVTLKSEPGLGTEFSVWLPHLKHPYQTVSPQAGRICRGAERVLLVDDEAGLAEAVRKMLIYFGYTVTARTGSLEALETFRADPDAFDLVITDFTMPNMTGVQLARELVWIKPGIPIILCTGFAADLSPEEIVPSVVSAIVMKPVMMDLMSRTIREVLDKRMDPFRVA